MAGVDEAGRGPLAGPVVAAAVILDDTKRIRGLADSKVLTPLQRDRLYDQIREKALCCSVAQASVEEIDTLNILHATMLAMKRAVEGLRLKPAKVLVDGNRLPTDRRAGRSRDRRRRQDQVDFRRVDPGQGAPRPAVRDAARGISRSTALPRTRATARPSTWRRCACTAPAATTASSSARSRPRSRSTTRAASRSPSRCRDLHRSRSSSARATTRCSRTCAGSRRTAPPIASRAASGWRATTCAARRWQRGVQARRSRCLPSPSGRVAATEWSGRRLEDVVIADALFAGLSGLESPARMGFVLELAAAPALAAGQRLRWSSTACRTPATSAPSCAARPPSAFARCWRIKGTAALWSPKVLRAGMGAHFGLRLVEGLEPAQLEALAVPRDRHQFAPGRVAAPAEAALALRLGVRPRRAGRQPEIAAPGRAFGAHRPAGRRGVAERRVRGRHLPARECCASAAECVTRVRCGYNQGLSRKPPVRLAHSSHLPDKSSHRESRLLKRVWAYP